MKRPRTIGLFGILVAIALTVALIAAGCGTAAQATSGSQTSTDAKTILQKALANASSVTSGAGTVNATVTVTADQSTAPASVSGLLGQPLKLTGSYSFNKTTKTGQADLSLAVAGQNLPVGLEAVNGQAWLLFLGQWYQTPAATEKSGDTTTTAQQSTATTIDPTTMLTNVTVVGDETINGVATTHISATVDVSKIATLKDTETTAAAASTSDTAAQQEMQQLQAGLTSAVKSLTIDLWISKDANQIRQAEVKATVVPPANLGQADTTTSQAGAPQSTATTESAAQAATKAALESVVKSIKTVSLDATVTIDPSATPKTVTAPTGAKPWTDLQTALQGFTSMLTGALGGESTTTSVQ